MLPCCATSAVTLVPRCGIQIQSPLTWEHGLNVPGEQAVQEGVHVHHDDGGAQAVVVLLQGAGHQVAPLDAHALLLEQGEVFTAEPERHGGKEALRDHMYSSQHKQYFTVQDLILHSVVVYLIIFTWIENVAFTATLANSSDMYIVHLSCINAHC